MKMECSYLRYFLEMLLKIVDGKLGRHIERKKSNERQLLCFCPEHITGQKLDP